MDGIQMEIDALIEQLRNRFGEHNPDGELCNEAADALAELRGDLAGSRLQVEMAYRKQDEQRDEITKLKSLVEKYGHSDCYLIRFGTGELWWTSTR